MDKDFFNKAVELVHEMDELNEAIRDWEGNRIVPSVRIPGDSGIYRTMNGAKCDKNIVADFRAAVIADFKARLAAAKAQFDAL